MNTNMDGEWIEAVDKSWDDGILTYGTEETVTGGDTTLYGATSGKVTTYNVAIASSNNTYKTIHDAYDAVTGGDSILVFDAGIYAETLTVAKINLVFQGYGIDYGVNDSLPVWQGSAGPDTLIFVDSTVTFVSFQFNTTDSLDDYFRVDGGNDPDITLRNCDLNGNLIVKRGMYPNESGSYSGTVVVDSCTIHDFLYAGFRVQQVGSFTASNNTFEHIGWAVSTGAAIFVYGSGGTTTIENNVITNCFSSGSTNGGGIFIRNQHASNKIRVIGNLIYNCDWGINEFNSGDDNYNNLFQFNTVVQCTLGGIRLRTSSSGPDTVKYNIVWSNGEGTSEDLDTTAGAGLGRPVADYNVYQTLGDWVAGSNSSNQYPVFVDTTDPDGADNIIGTYDDGFALQTSSPHLAISNYTTAGVDLAGITRPLPGGTNWDVGAYEESTIVGGIRIDSAVYYSNGTQNTNNDTLWIYFSGRLEKDSIQLSDFGIKGLGTIAGASINTPGGGDTSIVYIALVAGDTIINHNRDSLYVVANELFDTGSVLDTVAADTFTIITNNVSIVSSGNSYQTINEAIIAGSAGDSILVYDAGIYAESLSVDKNLTFVGYGIDYGSYDSLPVIQSSPDRDTMIYFTAPGTLVSFTFLETRGKNMLVLDGSSSPLMVKKCEFDGSDNTGRALYIGETGDGTVLFDSNTVHNFLRVAMRIDGDGAQTYSNNTFYNIAYGDAIGAINFKNANNFTVENNMFYNIGEITTSFGGAIALNNSTGRVIGNLIYNSAKGIYRYNSNNSNNYIAFNTVVQCSLFGIQLQSVASNPDTVKYNIAWSNAGNDLDTISGVAGERPLGDYNNYQTLGDWVLGSNSSAAYPDFTDTTDADGTDNILGTADDGFALKTSSPALNLSDISTSGVDITGTTRPIGGLWDAGAYEGVSIPSIDSVVYRSGTIAAVTDDTLMIYFNGMLEFDSLQIGDFGIKGLGDISSATITTPGAKTITTPGAKRRKYLIHSRCPPHNPKYPIDPP